jgi:hypothetical protein
MPPLEYVGNPYRTEIIGYPAASIVMLASIGSEHQPGSEHRGHAGLRPLCVVAVGCIHAPSAELDSSCLTRSAHVLGGAQGRYSGKEICLANGAV